MNLSINLSVNGVQRSVELDDPRVTLTCIYGGTLRFQGHHMIPKEGADFSKRLCSNNEMG